MGINWAGSGVATDPVDQRMFGTNMLFDRDRVGIDGTFDDSIALLNIEDVRYPGGSITEWMFDINDPDATRAWDPSRNGWRDLMPLSEFMGWAAEADIGVTLVVPTGSLMAGGPQGDRQPLASAFDDVYGYLTDVLQGRYGDGRIETIEIGNEYWLGAELNVVEYSRISNVIAEAAQLAIDDHRLREGLGSGWDEPEIAIQIGQYGKYSTTPGWVQNNQLIDWLTPAARAAVDAVVVHYYTRGSWDEIGNFGYYFDRLDTWAAAPGLGDIEYHVTEWNVNNQLSTELGMKQASAIWYMFAEMMVRGVDAASVWPAQQNNRTNLSGDEGQVELTIAGEAFRLLSEVTVGTRLVNRTTWSDGAAWVYADPAAPDAATHVFLASRSEASRTFILDTADLGLEDQTWWKVTLGTTGAPEDWQADPVLEIRADTAAYTGRLAFDLAPYEVVRVTFYETVDDSGLGTGFPHALVGSGRDDVIVGSDHGNTIRGLAGDDSITAGAGRDRIEAGAGNDTVDAGPGADRIDLGAGDDVFEDDPEGGSAGADKVFAGSGNDTVTGRGGGDSLSGQGGNDTISGGGGKDSLFGDRGNDRIWGGDGADELSGGSGDDSLSGGHDHDTVRGGEGEDTLKGDGGDDVLLGDDGDDRLSGWTGADLLAGGKGADTLEGGADADTLIGGDGDDWLAGNAGADHFVFDRDDGQDTIAGFDEDDVIDLRGRGISYAELEIARDGATALLQIAGTTVIFTDLAADLDKTDFLYF